MTIDEKISQLRDRTAYYRVALQELALMRCKLVCDGIRYPRVLLEASLKVNEQTIAVIQRALEVSTTRLETLEAEQHLRAMDKMADGVGPEFASPIFRKWRQPWGASRR